MSRASRAASVVVLSAAMAASAIPAAAQSVDTDASADASAGVLRVRLPGTDLLQVGESGASLRDDVATGTAVPLAIAGTPVGAQRAESTGDPVRAPAEGSGCLAPVDQLAGVLDLGLVCGVAAADLGAGTGSATSGVGDAAVLSTLDLTGAQLDQLETLVLQDLGVLAQLDALVGEALRGLVDPLADQCEISLTGLVDSVPELGDLPLDQLTAPLDDLLAQLTEQLPVACELLQTVTDVLAGQDGVLSSQSLAGVLDGTAGVIELTLLETSSAVSADGSSVRADARPTGAASLSLNLPLGDALRDGLEDVLTSLTDGLLGEITAPLADELGLSPDDPAGDLAAQLLGTEGLSGILLSDQLLTLALTPGRAAVAVAQSSGGAQELVAEPAIVQLGGALLDLPPLQTLESALQDGLAQLDAQLLSTLRDTPLADLVSVTLLEAATDENATVAGLPGASARSGAATVQLFAVADGGVQVEASPAMAAAGAAQAQTAQSPDPTLPVTGGGLALAGVLALAGAAGLRRRR